MLSKALLIQTARHPSGVFRSLSDSFLLKVVQRLFCFFHEDYKEQQLI